MVRSFCESLRHPPAVCALGDERFVSTCPFRCTKLRSVSFSVRTNYSDVPPSIQRAAEILYALIHNRFVTSPRGLDTLRRTLLHHKDIFGKCPRPSCRGMPMLPHGESFPGRNSQRYCCSCGQVWEWWDSKVDGSAWGPSLCHLYLLMYGKASLGGAGSMPQTNPTATVPTIFGFQVHPAALRRLHEH